MQSNDAKSLVCWDTQQREVIRIAFFLNETLAIGSVDEDTLGKSINYRTQIPEERVYFEETEKCKNARLCGRRQRL